MLLCFLHNGICFRSDILPLLIEMLEDLETCIKALPTFRYYSCSLLILYDGAICPKGLREVTPSMQEKDLTGIALRAKKYVEDLAAKEKLTGVASNSLLNEASLPPAPSTPPPVDRREAKSQEIQDPSLRMSTEELARARSHVDLRMIDFAHTTHSGFMDPTKHVGCDHGYLKGLDTLLKIFREMRRTYCDSNGHDTL